MSNAMADVMHGGALELGGSTRALTENEQLQYASNMRATATTLPPCILEIRSSSTVITVTIHQSVTMIDSMRAKISFTVKMPLYTQEVTITNMGYPYWLDGHIANFRIMNPTDFHITSGGIQEHYTYDEHWVGDKMAGRNVSKKHGVPQKPEDCGCGCGGDLTTHKLQDIVIERFCDLVNTEIWGE
jgi:hypothetical protein